MRSEAVASELLGCIGIIEYTLDKHAKRDLSQLKLKVTRTENIIRNSPKSDYAAPIVEMTSIEEWASQKP